MHPRLRTYLLGSRYAGIESEMCGDITRFHLVVIKRTGTKLHIEKVLTEIVTLEELKTALPKDIPCSVTFTGKGILYRYIQVAPAATPQTILGKVLPNAAIKDFFISATPSSGDGQLITVVRKATVQPVYEQLCKHLDITETHIGPLVACDVLRNSKGTKDEIKLGKHNIHFEANLPREVVYTDDEPDSSFIEFGAEQIISEGVIAFSAAFQSLIHGTGIPAIDETSDRRKQFLQRRLFQSGLKATLIGILIALAANYIAFSHYWKLQNELSSQLNGQGNSISELHALEEQYTAKRDFLYSTGLLSQTSYAWYADQVAHDMPEGIQLNQLNFSPLMKVANEDSIGFNNGQLQITGRCEESVVLNSWLQNLKSKAWIHSASIRSYQQSKSMTAGEFTLDLNLQ